MAACVGVGVWDYGGAAAWGPWHLVSVCARGHVGWGDEGRRIVRRWSGGPRLQQAPWQEVAVAVLGMVGNVRLPAPDDDCVRGPWAADSL